MTKPHWSLLTGAISLLVLGAFATAGAAQKGKTCVEGPALTCKKDERHLPLVVTSKATETMFFTMHEGACLVGPIAFYNGEGQPIFKLERDQEYPLGCRNPIPYLLRPER